MAKRFLPPPQACIFDLDGTLLDSLRDVGESLNECLELLGLETFPLDRYRYMVGEGIIKLCERALADRHPELLGRLIELSRARYRTRPERFTAPFAGVPGLIATLHRAGLPLAVLSNKPHDMTTLLVHRFWPQREFAEVQGYVLEAERKPDPTLALRLCEKLGVAPRETCLIGDTATDVETARRGGLIPLGVAWGYRPVDELVSAGAHALFDRPEDLAAALLAGR